MENTEFKLQLNIWMTIKLEDFDIDNILKAKNHMKIF